MTITELPRERTTRFVADEAPRFQRRNLDVLALVAGLLVFAVSGAVARGGVAAGERAVFDFVNSWPDALFVVIWPFMQYGVFVTIPILVVIAVILRRRRLAVAMAIAGLGVYFLAKLAKDIVERGRPDALLDGVVTRESFVAGSLGFPSGHTAVAAALTMVATPYLHGRWKLVPAALVVVVVIGRTYVAAHLPLDLVGGGALGAGAGALANLLVGTPTSTPSKTRRARP